MSTDSAKYRSLPALSTTSTSSSASQLDSPSDRRLSAENRKSRVLTKALRSLSTSSMDSNPLVYSKSTSSSRKLQKPQSSAGSIIDKLHRRASKDLLSSFAPVDGLGSPIDQPLASMEVLHYGPLKADVSLLKARSEYLVLTDQCLVKFSSAEAARSAFPQLTQAEGAAKTTHIPHHGHSKSLGAEARLEIPLRSIVASFNEEGSSPRFGIETWWHSQYPRLAYNKTHLFFGLPKERDDWLTAIQQACRARLRKFPVNSPIPENLRTRINHIVAVSESLPDGSTQSLVFPVAKRLLGATDRANATDEPQTSFDGPSYYLVIGPCMCHYIEVLKADCNTPPGELRIKARSFGTVTLNRFKASVASHEQRFMMNFHVPFGSNFRLDLASSSYRRIIEALTKADRVLKPMWPQHFQQTIFDIKGLPPPLELTSGNDLGGLEMSLQAYCRAFQVQTPSWTIDWNTTYCPTFRLLPEETSYLPLQLIAVFRALRYNSYFKGISLRDTDLSSLYGKRDNSIYGESAVNTSLNGVCISDDHHDIILHSPILAQEIHALAFASESIRSIDLTNVLGIRSSTVRFNKTHGADASIYKMSSELIQPLIMLLQTQLCHCNSISMSGNPLAPSDVEDLANVMRDGHVYLRKLDLSNCGLGDAGLSRIWYGLAGQCATMDTIDTSDNQGTVKFHIIRNTLSQLKSLTHLRIAGNTRIDSDESLLDEAAINGWALQELDLSGIALNDATVDVLARYMETIRSQDLRLVRLNRCRLTGRQIARLCRGMGQGRQLSLHLNANPIDDGIEDLCAAVACGFAPWALFMQMIEFNHEASYIKLLRALTVNRTIECLSLAGSSTPDAASNVACQAVTDFFAKNDSIRFLDISGYDAKLDEGRLGREFSKSLSGLRYNTRLVHLRVRNQMLNVNIGDLAEAISGNKTLHTLDCENNDFNISNFRHLIRHLEDNTNIRLFSAFSEKELLRTKQKLAETAAVVPTNKRSSMIARFKHEKPAAGTDILLAQQLMGELDSLVAKQRQILERNQTLHEERRASDAGVGLPPSPELDGESVFAATFGGLAHRERESRRANNSPAPRSPQRMSVSAFATLPVPSADTGSRVARSFSTVSSEAAMSPMTDGASSASGVPTPPELESPLERDTSLSSRHGRVVVQAEAAAKGCEFEAEQGEEGGLLIKSGRRVAGRS